jgi:hypothetical protein
MKKLIGDEAVNEVLTPKNTQLGVNTRNDGRVA